VSQGVIKPLCDLLECGDNRIIQVSLDGLENILKIGENDRPVTGSVNQYAIFIEEAGGMDRINNLQGHDNNDIYQKSFAIIDKYFNDEEGEDEALNPDVDDSGNFTFGGESAVPQGGFQFGN
jgi:hypothetical protein